MTNYEYLKELESLGKLKPLLKRGIVTQTTYDYISFYECYLFELKHTTSKMDAIETVLEACDISQKTLYRAIELMVAPA